MFGKIKGKFKGVFSNSSDEIFDEDEVLEEEEKKEEVLLDEKKKKSDETDDNSDGDDEEEVDDVEEVEEKPKKKGGFFSRVFGKKEEDKEEEEIDEEVEDIQDEVLEGVSEKEKEEIKAGEDVDAEIVEKNKKELEKTLDKEENIEKEEIAEVEKVAEEKVEKEKKKEKSKKDELPPKPDFLVDEKKLETKKEEEEIDEVEDVKEVTEKKIPKEDMKVAEPVIEEPKVEKIVEESEDVVEEVKVEEKKKGGFFSKTFGKLTSKKLTEDDFAKVWVELEIFLLEINIAFEIVLKIEERLKEEIVGNSFDRFSLAKKIREVLISEVSSVLVAREDDLLGQIREIREKGEVARILVLGVNGTGKTTSIAKFVHLLKKEGLSVVVAAADTFRAAAVEQLDEHANRVGFKLIKHKGGSDPAAVAFDAIEHAKAKNVDVVLIDTAGRMPNNANLMQELDKIRRVSDSQINLFIGDSVSGNDLLEQIELFDKVVGINGLILTKTDTDERPGSIVTAAYSLEKPIYFLGIGQGYDDLVEFKGREVAEKLFEI